MAVLMMDRAAKCSGSDQCNDREKEKKTEEKNNQSKRDGGIRSHHLDLLIHQLPILPHRLGELDLTVLEAVAIFVEGGALEGGLNFGRRGHYVFDATTAGGLRFDGRFGSAHGSDVRCVDVDVAVSGGNAN